MKKSVLLATVVVSLGVLISVFFYLYVVKGPLISKASHPTFGEYLADKKGMTLYVYSNDRLGQEPSCYDECLTHWIPFLSKGKDPQESSEKKKKKLRTTARKDGSLQYAYLGKPLYYFKPDENPGDIKGRGLNNLWSIVLISE